MVCPPWSVPAVLTIHLSCCSDYGYLHSNGLTGPCVVDESIDLQDSCAEGKISYRQSQGYRKVSGDVCVGGDESKYAAVDTLCCNDNSKESSSYKVMI